MWNNTPINLRFVMILLTMVSILSMGVLAEQCPQANDGKIMKSLSFYNSSEAKYSLIITDIEYDSESTDFFYLGFSSDSSCKSRYYYDDECKMYNHFVTKSDVYGNNLWINITSALLVHDSLVYSSINKIVYFSVDVKDKFVLLGLNSNDGSYALSYAIDGLQHNYRYGICRIYKDQTTIFCDPSKIKAQYYQSSTLTIFDTNANKFHIMNSRALSNSESVDIIPLTANKVYLDFCKYRSIHLIMMTLNTQDSSTFENFHKSIYTEYSRSIKAAVDEKEETIWHVMRFGPNPVYFKNKLYDFSLHGSMRITKIKEFYSNIHNIQIFEDFVVIRFYHFIVKVDKNTQNVINMYKLRDTMTSYPRPLLVKDGYINFITFEDTSVHYQIPISNNYYDSYFLQENFPLIEENTIRYMKIYNYDVQTRKYIILGEIKDEKRSEGRIDAVHETSTFSINFTQGKSEMFQTNDPTQFVYDSKIHIVKNFQPNQIENIIIDLPCDLDAYDSVNYFFHYYNNSSPAIQMLDFSFPKIKIKTPETFKFISNDIDVMVTYANTAILFKITVNVNSYITGWINDFEINAFKLSVGISTGLSVAARLIDGSPKRNDWAVIHMMQQIMLLPLISEFIPDQVEDMITYSGFPVQVLNTMSKKTLDDNPIRHKIRFDQSHPYLEKLDCVSGSTILDNIVLLVILILIGILNLLAIFACCLTCKWNNRFQKLITKMLRFSSFSLLIRILYETSIFLALMSIYEIWHHKEGDFYILNRKRKSKNGAVVILSLLGVYLTMTLLSWLCNLCNRNVDDETCISREFYSGLIKVPEETQDRNKNDQTEESIKDKILKCNFYFLVPAKVKIARLYPFLMLIKRLCFVLVIVLVPNKLFEVKVYSLMALQVIHVIYVYKIRNFYLKKDQYIDVANQVIYLILIIMLAFLQRFSDWYSKPKLSFTGIIITYSWFLAVFSATTFVQTLKNWITKPEDNEKEPSSEENGAKDGMSYSNVEAESNNEKSNDSDENIQESSLDETEEIKGTEENKKKKTIYLML